MPGWRVRSRSAARRPSSVNVGGSRMSMIATSGRDAIDRAQEAVDVTFGGDHVHARFGEQPRQALAQQDLVVHDRYSHGRTAISCWWPWLSAR